MSTRCVINFSFDGNTPQAKVYRHHDGYPEGVLGDLSKFFDDVREQTNDCRFNDPTYLAAKFVVWQAEQDRKTKREFGYNPEMLDFLGVGVVMENPGDIEYEYMVTCDGSLRVKYRSTIEEGGSVWKTSPFWEKIRNNL